MTEFQKSTPTDITSKEKLIVKIEEALNNRYVLEKCTNALSPNPKEDTKL